MAESEKLFDSLNSLNTSLEFLESSDAEDLKNQLRSIRFPTKILALYALGNRHFAWIQTTAKIKKTNKEGK